MSKSKTSSNGIVFVVSAPSGAGKTTLVREVLKHDPSLSKTISHTTRSPRQGEKQGRDYYFISQTRFRQMISRKDFVEWTSVYGNLYGTTHRTIDDRLKNGRDAILVIEARGARAIRRFYLGAVFILIVPPDLSELKRRIRGRAIMDPREMKIRLKAARKEIQSMRWYDYVIVNDKVADAADRLRSIIRAERLKLKREPFRLDI